LGLAQCASAEPPLSGRLPAAVTNNSVAYVGGEAGGTVYSFLGLGSGKTYADIVRSAFACDAATLACRALPDMPTPEGRLASAAAAVGGQIYIFGGYTVAASGAEGSAPEVFRFDPETEDYARVADMPTPVDDSTAIVQFDRYIYLVSGWHDTANVALVQVYDTREDRWFRATDFPGAPVFGHAGGAAGATLVIAGGVKLVVGADGRRAFVASDEVWRGDVADPGAPQTIVWRRLAQPPAGPFYRMAAGQGEADRVVFVGGGDNPYNYDGVGYDGTPARPSNRMLAYEVSTDVWLDLGVTAPSMDHRGLAVGPRDYFIVGGMGEGGVVLDEVRRIPR
jgi:N-acetylneuraminic acid mutarotase